MALVNNFFDTGQGKLGNLVFYKMKGKGIVRTRPNHFTDRKSPAQMAQRQRMQVVNQFLGHFRDLIRVTYSGVAESRTPRAEAFSNFMHNALAGEYPNIHIEKSKALLSSGPLPLPARAWMENHPDGLLIQWENGEEAAGDAVHDNLVVMALLEESLFSDFKFTGVTRSEGMYVWKTALKFPNDALPDVWIAFRNRQETQMSNSLWIQNQPY